MMPPWPGIAALVLGAAGCGSSSLPRDANRGDARPDEEAAARDGTAADSSLTDAGKNSDAPIADAAEEPGPCSSCPLPTNGTMWPSSFVPYSPKSVWNTPLAKTSHTYASDSATIIATQFPSTTDTYTEFSGSEPGEYDPSVQLYFASASDPLVTIDCGDGGACGPGMPASMHIPAKAHINDSNNDNIMMVVQPDGTELDFYCWDVYDDHECEPPGWTSEGNGAWSEGDTFSVGGSSTNCGNFLTGAGWNGATSPSDGAHASGYGAGGNCAGAGLLDARELASGVINHALQVVPECTAQSSVFPGYWDTSGPNPCSGPAPPIGYRMWYDVSCSDTQSNPSLGPWEKAILCALNVYGGFVTDNQSDTGAQEPGFGVRAMGEVPSYEFGTGDQWAQLGTQGWSSFVVGGDWSSSFPRWGPTAHTDGSGNWIPPGVDFHDHMHYLDPCVTKGTCP
jgi:hypothetical protein